MLLSTVICFVTINYFGEYHNQFNNFLFLGLYDDQKQDEDYNGRFSSVANLIGMLLTIIAYGFCGILNTKILSTDGQNFDLKSSRCRGNGQFDFDGF
ncbi:MAG: hypothetical protein U0X58_00765 [Flavobacteriaceae bacterium]